MKIPDKIADQLKPGQAVVTYSVPTKSGTKHIRFLKAKVNDENEEEQGGMLERQAKDGLQALSDEELNCLLQLTAKVHAADPDYELDPKSRYVVEYYNRESQRHEKGSDSSDSARNAPRQPKNTQKKKEDDLVLDDLSLDDLGPDDNEIPSEETDPPHLRKYRRRRR